MTITREAVSIIRFSLRLPFDKNKVGRTKRESTEDVVGWFRASIQELSSENGTESTGT